MTALIERGVLRIVTGGSADGLAGQPPAGGRGTHDRVGQDLRGGRVGPGPPGLPARPLAPGYSPNRSPESPATSPRVISYQAAAGATSSNARPATSRPCWCTTRGSAARPPGAGNGKPPLHRASTRPDLPRQHPTRPLPMQRHGHGRTIRWLRNAGAGDRSAKGGIAMGSRSRSWRSDREFCGYGDRRARDAPP